MQRRHQKVIELAPAPNLDPRSCATRSAPTRSRSPATSATAARAPSSSCSTSAGSYVFIEMNPRIQVEHTVTEEITDVDLVSSQLRIASGETLDDLGLRQEDIRPHGAALQCRITTEDPANGFRPDTGRISALPQARRRGHPPRRRHRTWAPRSRPLRFDAGQADLPGPRLPDRGEPGAPRDRGVPHPRRVDEYPVPAGGAGRPGLPGRPRHHVVHRRAPAAADRAIIGRPRHQDPQLPGRRHRQQAARLAAVDGVPARQAARRSISRSRRRPGPSSGWSSWGRRASRAGCASRRRCGVTDTTFRDAHQSLLATRVRTSGLMMVAPYLARTMPQLLSVECWGGATYDVALRFLKEDPWERLAALREAMPNICLQMLLRGRNTVGYTPYPELVTSAFVDEATATGIDIFRIFDALNNLDSMRPAIDAVRETGSAIAEVAMCYTGDLSDPGEHLYTLDYYLKLAEQIVDAGAHVLAIKDMAGLLRPPAAATTGRRAAQSLRPAGARAHPRHPGRPAGQLPRRLAGRGRRGRRRGRADGGNHQPARAELDRRGRRAHRLRHRPVAVGGLRARAVLGGAAKGLRALRIRAAGADRAGLPPRDPRRPAVEPAPAGHRAGAGGPVRGGRRGLRRCRPGAGQADQGHAVVEGGRRPGAGPGRRRGRVPTNSPPIQARFDIPESVLGFLRGELGDPAGGWPEPLRTKALAGRGARQARPSS